MVTNPKERAQLEAELAQMNARHNELAQLEQVKLSESQTLERYIEKGKTWMDSLQNQIATQMVLLNKLTTDTKQRVVLYDALSSSRPIKKLKLLWPRLAPQQILTWLR